jgi:xanthine phosphoribosyltransferase
MPLSTRGRARGSLRESFPEYLRKFAEQIGFARREAPAIMRTMGNASRYDDEVVISWPELHRDARYLSGLLHTMGEWKGIIAITRGGLVPAALVARELEIRLIDTVCVTSYGAGEGGGAANQQGAVKILKGVAGDGEGFLLIDDLVDTGRTAQVVRQLLPKAHFATLYAKPAGRPIVDTCVKEFKQNKWIFFPWDIDYQFVKPIKDGGRANGGA